MLGGQSKEKLTGGLFEGSTQRIKSFLADENWPALLCWEDPNCSSILTTSFRFRLRDWLGEERVCLRLRWRWDAVFGEVDVEDVRSDILIRPKLYR